MTKKNKNVRIKMCILFSEIARFNICDIDVVSSFSCYTITRNVPIYL